MMLRSDLHVHTLMSGHAFCTLNECVGAAQERGLSLMAITDHGPAMEHSAHEGYFEMGARLPKQMGGLQVLFGCEMNILNKSGDVDLSAKTMSGLDIVLAGLHARTPYDGTGEAGNTEAIINAMARHPNINILTHPFRAEFPICVRDVAQAAKEYRVILEINLSLLRKALDNQWDGNSAAIVDRTAEMVSCTHSAGGRYVISSDAHHSSEIGIGDGQYGRLVRELGLLPEYVLNGRLEELKGFIPSIALEGESGMNGKKAVIVGGTGQIGKCIVEALQKEGYLTICVSSRPLPDSEKNQGTEYHVFDMTDSKAVEECCAKIAERHGMVDALINVIGKNRGGDLCGITEEMWNDVMDTNLKSVFFTCRTFRDLLARTGDASIVNFASTAGIRALPKSPHYIAAKAGVIALTEYFARIFAPTVRVNCVAPGVVLTENHKPGKYGNYDRMIDAIPLHRMASTGDVVGAVRYLLGAASVTGHTLVVDGGMIL